MFFYIGDHCPIQALTKVTDRLFLDKGWSNINNIWYKGYSTECVLKDNLDKIIEGYQPAGKWCVIQDEKIYHPVLQGFPLFQKDTQLTNISIDGMHIVDYTQPNMVIGSQLTLDEASKLIGDVLLENTINFYKYNSITEMNVLVTGGLDTLTSWAVLDSYTKEYTLNVYVPNENDDTLYKFLGRKREYTSDLIDKVSTDCWGYEVSSFFSEINWYLTGYYAEVFHFRDAEAIHALANYQGKWIDEMAEEKDYLYWFLKRPTLNEYKKSMLSFDDEHSLKLHLYNTIFRDHQMWHLDNNMTFNPFFDIRIPNIMLRLSIEDISKNCTTGLIQRKIVERFNPQLLTLLSDYKNEKDVWGNFRKHWASITLDPKVKINIR